MRTQARSKRKKIVALLELWFEERALRSEAKRIFSKVIGAHYGSK